MKMPGGMGIYDEKIQELMKFMDEKGVVEEGEPSPEQLAKEKEELMRQLEQRQPSGATAEESAMYEFQMMMQQWDSLVADYERREAEEQAEAAAKGGTE